MSSPAERIIDEALALPNEERRTVVERLTQSLVDDDAVDPAWRDEILRRLATLRDGSATLESWDEVRRRGREALASR